jgi:hypothetical protein
MKVLMVEKRQSKLIILIFFGFHIIGSNIQAQFQQANSLKRQEIARSTYSNVLGKIVVGLGSLMFGYGGYDTLFTNNASLKGTYVLIGSLIPISFGAGLIVADYEKSC